MKLFHIFVVIGFVAMLAPTELFAQQAAPAATTVPGSTGTVAPGTIAPISVCPYENIILRPGTRSDEIKALQSILAQDPTIYPQGVTSGYYGTLTQDAIKRLQRKFGLPESGVLDENIRPIIFPCVTISVTSPNGGETWRIGSTQTITWETQAPYILRMMNQIREKQPTATQAAPQANAIMPFFQNLSIDLIRYDGPQIMIYPAPVYHHIGSASLYGDRSLSWTIPSTIANSQMYKVRITLWKGGRVPESNAYPRQWEGNLWDESDGYFAVTGGTTVSPLPTPTVTPAPDYGKLRAIRSQLQQALESIQKAIAAIDALLGILPTAR